MGGSLYRRGSDFVRAVGRRAGWIDLSRSLVVFTANDKMLRRMTIADGPCVPVGKRPLVVASRQEPGDTFDDVAWLMPLLTGRPSDAAWQSATQDGPGELRQMTPEFATALGALAAGEDYAERRAVIDPVAERWLKEHRWPPGFQVGGLSRALQDWSRVLARGLARGEQGYCWRGPSVPIYEVVSYPL